MKRLRKWVRTDDGLPEMLSPAGLTVEQFKTLVAAGKAPKPHYLFPRAALWDRAVLAVWLDDRAAQQAQVAAEAAAEVIA